VKIFVPMALFRANPYLWRAATCCPSQEVADRLIAGAGVGLRKKPKSKPGVFKEDVQAAGAYSLRTCTGGALNHRPSQRPPPKFTDHRQSVTHMTVSFSEPQEVCPVTKDRVYPRGTKRCAGHQGGMLLP